MTRSLIFVTALFATACSLKKMAVDQTADVLADGSRAFDIETDPDLAAAAIPASLKTMESFLQAHPTQPTLLRLLAEGYMNYAFGFLEDDAERLQDKDPDGAEHLRGRALDYYLRARGFALRLLALDAKDVTETLQKGDAPSEAQLKKLGKDELPALFWVANTWAAAINVGKSKPDLVAQLPIVRALMERAAAIDETFYHAGPRMVLGALDAALPKAFGGKPEAAKVSFDKATQLTGGKFLMISVLYAKAVAAPSGDRAGFEKALKDVMAADVDVDPNVGLANRLAKRRASRYLADEANLFLD